jgi:hypothetical protein
MGNSRILFQQRSTAASKYHSVKFLPFLATGIPAGDAKNLIFPLAFRKRVRYGFISFQGNDRISTGPAFPAFFIV